MRNLLAILGLNEKQIQVFEYLVEYGISPASEISKCISIPKSTVNFLADTLWKNWYLKKSFRWKTWYYEIDIEMLRHWIGSEIEKQQTAFERLIPQLREKMVFSKLNKPKITFLEGVENCQNAYLDLLNVDIFYEFGAHADLENSFGKKFMSDFIQKRIQKWVFCDSIGTTWEIEQALQKLDSTQQRDLKIFDAQIYGKISSSIAIYDDKVLILNVDVIPMWVLIQNSQFSETMKTVYMICKK